MSDEENTDDERLPRWKPKCDICSGRPTHLTLPRAVSCARDECMRAARALSRHRDAVIAVQAAKGALEYVTIVAEERRQAYLVALGRSAEASRQPPGRLDDAPAERPQDGSVTGDE